MARKTYALANGECMGETADSPMNQEILLGGHLYLMYLKVQRLVTIIISMSIIIVTIYI